MNRSVVLLISHFYNELVASRLSKLQHDLESSNYDVVLLLNVADNAAPIAPNHGEPVYRCSMPMLQELNYTPICNTLIPGSSHFLLLRFFKDFPHYDNYWFVEYDVMFTGNWRSMFADCDKNLADYSMLTCHVECLNPKVNGQWPWWLRENHCGFASSLWIKGFNPIYRISNSGLQCLDFHLSKGYSAHSELMLTTCLNANSLPIADIGGKGEFTPMGYESKYYVSAPGINNGTMRWRPLFSKQEIESMNMPDKLYHPLK